MKWLACAVVVTGLSTPAAAHEFWIAPDEFQTDPGRAMGIALCLGDPFQGGMVARETTHLAEFVSFGPSSQRLPIVGREGYHPAGVARLIVPGPYVLGYRSTRSFTEMGPLEFEQHLLEKGLESIIALRKQFGASNENAREAYSRYAKAIVRVGDAAQGSAGRTVGHRLEIINEFDPYRGSEHGVHTFRLLFDGEPLRGALVTATPRSSPDVRLRTRTSAEGFATYVLPSDGMWLIEAVHMIEAPPDVAADWESFWASLTFELSLPSAKPAWSQDARSSGCSAHRPGSGAE